MVPSLVIEPPVFQDATYEQTLQRAAADGRWAIIVATSPSSPLGAMMDKTTWRNRRVGAWLAEKAVAARLDVSEDELLARRLKARTLPTVIALKDGAEKARFEGFRDAHHLLLWFMSLDGQETPLSPIIQAPGGDLERDMHGRLSFARALLEEQRYGEAAEHYLWMWDNIARVDPGMSGVRVSFMAGDMERLASADEPARQRFAALRDQAATAADARPADEGKRLDWVVLNKVLGDEDRTLAWFDGAKEETIGTRVIHGISRFFSELLKQRGRWADLGRLYRDPLKELSFQHEVSSVQLPVMPGMPAEARDRVRQVMAQQFRRAAAVLVASLRAAGRADEATAVLDEAVRLDPSDDMKRAIADGPAAQD